MLKPRLSSSNLTKLLSAHSLRFFSSFSSAKLHDSPESALAASKLASGNTLLVGGFGLCGIPMTLIQALANTPIKDLTVVSNNCGVDDWGNDVLLKKKKIKKLIASYVGENKHLEKEYLSGNIEIHFTPQGTLAEKLRAGGAGIPAFYTPIGVDTLVEKGGQPLLYSPSSSSSSSLPTPLSLSSGKEVRSFQGRKHILEESIKGEVALIKAWKADSHGNLIFKATDMNFNPECAKAAKYCIAEVEEIVPRLEPAQIHIPSIYVHALVLSKAEKRIEKVVTEEKAREANGVRRRIAQRLSKEFLPGMAVNLGIGIPTLSLSFAPEGVFFHSENGILGVGGYPRGEKEVDPDLVNAGKETVTMREGAAIFSSGESFAMVRGGHLDLTVLGALEVDEEGSLANWVVPGKMVKGVGGAMDLVGSGSRVIVALEHCDKKGESKILEKCMLPLTGKKCVDMIVTERCVFKVEREGKEKGLVLVELHPDYKVEDIRACTKAKFRVSEKLQKYQ